MTPRPAFLPAASPTVVAHWHRRGAVITHSRPSATPVCVATSSAQLSDGPKPPSAPTPPPPRPNNPASLSSPSAPNAPPARPPPASERSPSHFADRRAAAERSRGGGGAPSRGDGAPTRSFAPREGGRPQPSGERRFYPREGASREGAPTGERRFTPRDGGGRPGGERDFRGGTRGGREQRGEMRSSASRGPRPPRRPIPPGATTYTECGKCGAAYEIKAADLGDEGRKVVCAVCTNSWFQRGESLRFLKDGTSFKDYPLEKKDEYISQREARRGGPGGGRPQYGGGPGQEYTRERQVESRDRFGDRGGSRGGEREQRGPPRGPRAGNAKHTLFIGNIAYEVEKRELEGIINGEVEGVQRLSLVTDPDGRSKGFAFADMESEQAVQNAVNALDGYEIDGRSLTVRIGRPKN